VQIIGEECFVAVVLKEANQTLITIKDRFVLKFIPPVVIQLNEIQFGSNHEAMLGYVPPNMRNNYPIRIEGAMVYVNLMKDQKKL
jgi:hypothetical protein